MKFSNYFSASIKSVALTTSALAALASSAVTIPNAPLGTQISAKPMVMLVAAKDHKLFFEAYNDASDLDGDGKLDIRFKPAITYYGLFDSTLCYTHNDESDNTGLFTPTSTAASGKCSGKWSGNWLNYMTTSRVDALRKVLYGGHREVDTAEQTILRRAYIPQDGHSWAKEYTSETVDGYKISDYTPVSLPTGSKRHFFGNVTLNASTNCATLNTCSDLSPLLSVVTNSSKRVWDWASKQSPVLDGSHGGTRTDYTVRVEVCTSSFNEGCKKYGSKFKPTGLLHDYGENDSMLFGLLTGSYNKNMSGGVLRKVVSSFKSEVNSGTGQFESGSDVIVSNFNNLRIRDFNNFSDGTKPGRYRNGSFRTGPMAEGAYVDWGNPLGEMMYETLRYFGGAKAPTSAFDTSGSHDAAVGLTRVSTWDDPYASTSSAAAARCARPNMLVMSDVYPSYDGDQVPGSSFSAVTDAKFPSLNVATLLNQISSAELGVIGTRFIGQSTLTNLDYAPTPKAVTTLATVRGLAPEETTKQGSYSSTAVAYYGRTNDVNATAAGKQTINSYFLALSSTLPKFEVPINGKLIQIIPFAKTIDGASTDRKKLKYQPTDPIVDLYVTKDDLAGTSRELKFTINYEADEQGYDFDSDVITDYTIRANLDSTVTVEVEVRAESTGSNQNVGYVISGTGGNRDGIYLVAQDKNEDLGYFLNVPPGRSQGYCDTDTTIALAECRKLPYLTGTTPKSTQTFSAGAGTTAEFLKDPLWYAAKWGGFNDANGNNKPDLAGEWDTNADGVPDTYFLVQNPLKLKESLKKAFDAISEVKSSASNVAANSSSSTTEKRVYRASFDQKGWAGNLKAYAVTSSGVSASPEWEASANMPAPANRKIFLRTKGDTTKEFLWANLNATNKALLDSDPSATDNSQDVVDYLRGVRTKELQYSGDFRNRSTHVLGDIAHSSPFYDKDSDTIFVGANDGMLHAFKASDGTVAGSAGKELFGFIPSEVLSRLKNLTSTGYTHEYFVDGDVVVSPKTTETGNKNLLFAALGRGGKGLFSLDVTDPKNFSTANFRWEYTPEGDSSSITDGVLDTTNMAATDNDLGMMLGRPVFVKMNNGQAAVIVGNGYNSTNEKAVLYIFLLNTSGQVTQVKKLDTLAGGDNGLATPGTFDVDNNGTVDFIYAGDLKGNVWKFDVSGNTPSSWVVSLSGAPLFVAKDALNHRQPITAPITISKNAVAGDTHEGKRFVFFGSGSYFQTEDPSDTAVQSWYGLIDDDRAISGRDQLTSRSFANTGTLDGKSVRAVSAAVANDMVGKKGWYLDFTSSARERVVTQSVVYKRAVPTLVASSIIPDASDPCVPGGGDGYINAISPFSGGSLTTGILDLNRDGNYTNDKISGANVTSVKVIGGMPGETVLIGKYLVFGTTGEGGEEGGDKAKPVDDLLTNPGATPVKGRISWREIIKD